jgi:hypothetical protein
MGGILRLRSMELNGREALRREALAVLAANAVGGWTKPSPNQYPHQWNWDTAFIALSWSQLDWGRAVGELESLLRGQWRDGMVPHVRYDPQRLGLYFPGPDRWPRAAGRTIVPGVPTSGLSNPPLVVSAAFIVGQRQADEGRRLAFYSDLYPRLAAWLRWFQRARRLPESPLLVMVHPWESGWDNSPRWDHLGAAHLKPRRPFRRLDRAHVRLAERPTDRDYDGYLALAELLDDSDYDLTRYRESSPFLVYDVLVDALWYRAAVDLGRMAKALGRPSLISRSELSEFAAAFQERHWSESLGLYVDYDIVSARRIEVPTPAGLAAAASGLIAATQARESLYRYLNTGPGLVPLWTTPPAVSGFDPVRYWRGPVWAPVNWLVWWGLRELGLRKEADALAATTLRLVERSGFAEHFNPVDSSPGGSGSFSWTAAVTLELLVDSVG